MELNDRIKLARQVAHNRLFESYGRLMAVFHILDADIADIFNDNDSYDRADERFQAAFRHLNRCHGLMFTKQQLGKLLGKKKRKIGKNPVSKKKIESDAGALTTFVRIWSIFGVYRDSEEDFTSPDRSINPHELRERMSVDQRRYMSLEQGRMMKKFNLIPNNSFSPFVVDVQTDDDLQRQYSKFSDLVFATYDGFMKLRGKKGNPEFPKNLQLFDRYILLQYLEECYRQHKAYLRDRDK